MIEIQTEKCFKIEGNLVFLPNYMIEQLKEAAKKRYISARIFRLVRKMRGFK